MPEITLVRQDHPLDRKRMAEALRELSEVVDGLGEKDRRSWRRFLRGMTRLEPGEMAQITTLMPRVGPFHRMHMAMEQAVFAGQERFTDFKAFRDWLKLGAGHVEWLPSPTGPGLVPVPKSISYSAIEEGEMREFHRATVDFLRTDMAQSRLWPHAPAEARGALIERVLEGFD